MEGSDCCGRGLAQAVEQPDGVRAEPGLEVGNTEAGADSG